MTTSTRSCSALCIIIVGTTLAVSPSACSLDASGFSGVGAPASASSSGAASGSSSGSGSSSAALGSGGAAASSAASSSSAASGSGGAGGGGMDGATCDDIHKANMQAPNGVYTLDPDGAGGSPPFQAYCEMKGDGGGWTLALKIDGNQQTFAYDAQIWKDDNTYQPDKPDLDTNEAKLATFSAVTFTSVRLGMIDAGMTRWIMSMPAMPKTLSGLIKGGQFTATSIGRSGWQKLVASPSLQLYCNVEGFNVYPPPSMYARARIGIVANEQNDCSSPDSFIGYGAEDGHGMAATGNFASYNPENGNRTTKTFGYVMVR